MVTPGQELNLTLNLTNIGNTDDLLTLTPIFEINYQGNDVSNWSAPILNSSRLDVFESETLHLVVNIQMTHGLQQRLNYLCLHHRVASKSNTM